MASNKSVAAAVSDVFNAAHATPTQPEVVLYAKALADVTDAELEGAVTRLVSSETWAFGRKPSPALVLEWVSIERAALAARRPPEPAPPAIPPDVAAERMAEVRDARAAGIRASRLERA